MPATNRPAKALTAVLPLPNTSHAKPVRVAQSFQFGVFSIAVDRARPAMKNEPGTDLRRHAGVEMVEPAPRLIVNRSSRH